MSEFDECRQACSGLFATGWRMPDTSLRTRIEWPNGETMAPNGDEKWVRFTLQSGDARRISVGNPGRFRRIGRVIVQVFVPLNTGDGEAIRLADRVADIYRDQTITTASGAVRFAAPSLREIGVSDMWYQVNTICPFTRDFRGGP